MSKMSQEIFDFFNNKETYRKTERLVESFNEFQQELFLQFWNKLYEYIKSNFKLNGWVVEVETYKLENETSYILIRHEKDINYLLFFKIYCKKSDSGYGIECEKESNPLDIEKIYLELQVEKFKNQGWKFGPIKKSWMPLYYPMKSCYFKDSKSFEILLPDQIDESIKQIGDEFINGFDSDLQNYIIKKLNEVVI